MVLRSYNNANANGGVAYVQANNDSSNTNTNNGSRLANRIGKPEKAASAEVTGSDEEDAATVNGHAMADDSLRSLSSLTTPSGTLKEVENHVRVVIGGE